MSNNKARIKVVYQCSGCDNPICDGDKYVKTPYGYFCSDCVEEGYAEYHHDDADLSEFFGDVMGELAKLSVWG